MLASSREPRGGTGFPGRDLRPKSRRCAAVGLRNAPAGGIKSRPYESILCFGPTGTAAATRAAVGRDAPHPAGPCGGADVPILKLPRCGGRERPPYGAGANAAADRKIAAGVGFCGRGHGPPLRTAANARPNGKPQPCGIANPCRGRCLHRPGNLAAARTSRRGISGLRAAAGAAVGPPKRACGRSKSRPYESISCFGPTGMAAATRGVRRAGCPPSRRTPRAAWMFRF